MAIKQMITAAAAVMALCCPRPAFGAVTSPAVGNLTVEAPGSPASELRIAFTVDHRDRRIPSENCVTLTPLIVADGSNERLALRPVVIAGRSRAIRLDRNPGAMPADATLLRAGKGDTYHYSTTVNLEDWMRNATVVMQVEEQGCCGRKQSDAPYPLAAITPCPAPAPAPPVNEPPSTLTERIEHIYELNGKAYIDFRRNSTDIDTLYHDNPSELHKIIASIDSVRLNPAATIREIIIKGYASPEGSYANNDRLSRGRAAALADYVRSLYDLPDSVFRHDNEPEDWQGLTEALRHLELTDKAAIENIIATVNDPDKRDAAIRKRFPRQYAYLLENVYPRLRHSDYTVRYTLRDIEEVTRTIPGAPKPAAGPAAGPEPAVSPGPGCVIIRYLHGTADSES